MSGPKGYSYTVVSPAELARREVEAIRGRCTALRDRLAALDVDARQLTGKPLSVPRPPRGDGVEEWRRSEERLRALVGTAGDELAGARREAWATGLLARSATLAGQVSVELIDRAATPAPRPAKATPADEVRASVARALAVAAGLADRDLQEQLVRRSEEVAALLGAADVTGARGRLAVLQAEVQEAGRAQRRVAAVEQRRQQLDVALAGIAGDEALALRARSRTASDAECADLELRLAELRVRVAAEADRAFVVRQAAEVLHELGYPVDAAFTVDVLAGRAALTGVPDDEAIAGVRLQLLAGRSQLITNAVGFDDQPTSEDVELEEAFCGQQGELRAGLRDRGVSTELVHARPIGEIPVERVGRMRSGQAAGARRRGGRARLREQGR